MKHIIKFLFLAITLPFFLNSCRDEANKDWASEAPTLKLYDTSLGTNVLYPSMETNPFKLTWDNTLSITTTYNVVMSTTEDFKTKAVLGTSNTNTYITTIGALNTALLSAGYSPYLSQKVYVRIEAGDKVSNALSFDVIPYPVSIPGIISPTAGQVFVLDKNNPDTKITNVTWSDYSNYGVLVNYQIEVSPKGTNNWISAGSVENLKTFEWTNKSLNDVLTKLALTPNVAADIDVRVTATSTTKGGTIKKISNIITINVTPYVAFKNLYLVGDATSAGWNNNNNNQPLFRDPVTPSKFYFTGYFNAGGFKLLENLGQWHPQWGQKNGVLQASNPDGSNEGDTFAVSTPGYYTFTIDIVAKTYSLTSYTGSVDTYYGALGIIGTATPNDWNEPDTTMERSVFDPHLWQIKSQVLKNGEMKFRADGAWTVNWGPTDELKSVSTLSGVGVQDGKDFHVDGATYDIYFNDLDGRYQLIKK